MIWKCTSRALIVSSAKFSHASTSCFEESLGAIGKKVCGDKEVIDAGLATCHMYGYVLEDDALSAKASDMPIINTLVQEDGTHVPKLCSPILRQCKFTLAMIMLLTRRR